MGVYEWEGEGEWRSYDTISNTFIALLSHFQILSHFWVMQSNRKKKKMKGEY